MRTALSELKSQMERDGYFKDGSDLYDLLLFAEVKWHDHYSEESIHAQLGACCDYDEEYFINLLSQMYVDGGYGSNNVYGTIWLVDRTFYRRVEYDGCGSWEHIKIDPPTYLDPNGTFAGD